MSGTTIDPFGARDTLATPLGPRTVFRLDSLASLGNVDALPYCIKVLLESCLRHLDGHAVKDWGFETRTSTLSMLLSSKTLTGTAAGAVASVLFGVPSLAAAAAIAGTFVEIGKVSVHLAKRKYGLTKLRRDHPMSYIIDAKMLLEKR